MKMNMKRVHEHVIVCVYIHVYICLIHVICVRYSHTHLISA